MVYAGQLKIAPKSHELLIAIFTPLITNFCSAIMEYHSSGIFLCLNGSLYFGAAVMCSLLQAELDGLLYTVVLGVIHGSDLSIYLSFAFITY